MRVLGIDTSGRGGGVALVVDGALVAALDMGPPGRQAEQILAVTDALLSGASLTPGEIDLFAVSLGPGSFTGLRIGMAHVMGIATGVSRPVVGVSSLEILAEWANRVTEGEGLACWGVLDARRGEVYHAGFTPEGGSLTLVSPPACGRIEDLGTLIEASVERHHRPGRDGPVVLAGDGVPALAAEIAAWVRPVKTVFPPLPAESARLTAELGLARFRSEGPSPLLEPLYLRPADARLPARSPGLARDMISRAGHDRKPAPGETP